MKREELVRKLETVAPALSENALLPTLQHFWFTGTHVMAYNDAISISVPFETNFQCTTPGKIMLEIVKSISQPNCDLEQVGNHLLLKAGNGRYKFAIDKPEKFLFEMPIIPKVSDVDSTPSTLLKCIENCMRSVVSDTSIPEQLGVTIIPNKEQVLHLYGVNNATFSHSTIRTKKPTKIKRVILSASFCEQMLRLGSKAKKITFNLFDNYALFSVADTILFGRLIEGHIKPLDLDGILKYHLAGDEYKENLWQIPRKEKEQDQDQDQEVEDLKGAIERACIMTTATVDKTYTMVSTDKGLLKFYSKSSRGEALDSIISPKNQPKVTINVDAKLIKDGLDAFDNILFKTECVIMSKSRHLYLVGCTT